MSNINYLDKVEHPVHYNSHPSGIECIEVVEHMNFNLGNAVKYLWRADLKGQDRQDLEKAKFYIQRELDRRFPEPKVHPQNIQMELPLNTRTPQSQ